MRLLLGVLVLASTAFVANMTMIDNSEAAFWDRWRTPTPRPSTPTRTPVSATATPVSATPAPTATPNAGTAPATKYSNASGPCLVIDGESNKVYENLLVGPCGREGIIVKNSSGITIRNVTVFGSTANIFILSSDNVTVSDSTFKDPTGPKPRGQQILVELSDNVKLQRNTLTFNSGFQEDAINDYRSSNVLIEGNSITGGSSPTGCGILVDLDSDYATIRNNVIRHIPNCGIGLSTGIGHLVEGNDIADYGFAGTGNVGIYVWNQHLSPCRDITIRNNKVGKSNPFWNGNNCSNVTVTGNVW